MKTLEFKRESKVLGGEVGGYEKLVNYVCGNWEIVNIGSGWAVLYKQRQIIVTNTLKEAKSNVIGMVAFNDDMI